MRALAQTQIVIALTINTNKEQQITTILQLLFSVALLLSDTWRGCLNLAWWFVDLVEAIGFAAKIIHIRFISLRWGLLNW